VANWYGTSRSNYFRVKDAGAFLKWADERGLGVFKHQHDEGVFAIHGGASTDDGSWPSYDMEEDEDIDLVAELAEHLCGDQIAVLLEIGAEKLRYLTGVAIALNSQGATVELTLSDVYRTAAHTFRVPESAITRAEY
jgi:hypothetical protein